MLDISKLSVLIVDNEPDNLEVMFEVLEFSGFSVKTATNGVEGMAVLQTFSPDLILLDLSMPVMDGWEMHSRLKATPRTQHIPVVALTAHAMSGDEERVYAAGFDGYLSKPVEIGTLLATIVGFIEGHQASESALSDAPLEDPDSLPKAPEDQLDSRSSKG